MKTLNILFITIQNREARVENRDSIRRKNRDELLNLTRTCFYSEYLLLFLVLFFSCSTKEVSEEKRSLSANAITIKNLSTLNDKIYQELSNYNIILVGELHGTNEPSEFVSGLCNLITAHEEKVILGLEIPPSQMESFSDTMSLAQLKQLSFFSGENTSGMNGEAWLHLINRSNQNKQIITKFIDLQNLAPRDSAMYNSIYELRKAYPNTKIVTLTGNLHNWLKPFRGKKMLGGYLMADTVHFDNKKIMSVVHIFNQGTMLNNTGNGLELKTFEGKDNIYNKTVSSNMFFCKSIFKEQDHYTHFLYTDKVTHSKVLENR